MQVWFRIAATTLLVLLDPQAGAAPEVIHVFVALADNASQGIAPVPAKIGDGDRPAENLYWGCSEGVKSWFLASRHWKKAEMPAPPRAEILERLVFRHREHDAWLVADAWRGREIRTSLRTFLQCAAGASVEKIACGGNEIQAGGGATMLAYVGHNGLMDFAPEWPPARAEKGPSVVVLCCLSQRYFADGLRGLGARPELMTTQLMYPGAFILHDALEARFAGKPAPGMREAAAAAYARNQGISLKAARGVFATPETPPAR